MESFDFALQIMVIGFTVVIVTLTGLYGILLIFARIFYKKADDRPFNIASPGADSQGESDELLQDRRKAAAITAAVYQYLVDQNSLTGKGILNIAVQPFGRTSEASWHIVGRKELLARRMELEKIRRKKKRENI